jgi:hypothetical protein
MAVRYYQYQRVKRARSFFGSSSPDLQFDIGTDVGVLIGEVKKFRQKALEKIEVDVDEVAENFRDLVVAHAQGRPGPEEITGGYTGSIQVSTERFGIIREGFSKSVVSDHPAAARLELGFFDTDALGRHYNQPPFPHWAPAIAITEQEWLDRYNNAPQEWWPT